MQKDELRYGRLGDIIQVMISMKSSKKGLSLEDIERELSCNRRTAERVRDVLMRIFPQIGLCKVSIARNIGALTRITREILQGRFCIFPMMN